MKAGDGKNPVFWDSPRQGTYKQPDNNRRLKRTAIRDHGFRQFKKSGALRAYNALTNHA